MPLASIGFSARPFYASRLAAPCFIGSPLFGRWQTGKLCKIRSNVYLNLLRTAKFSSSLSFNKPSFKVVLSHFPQGDKAGHLVKFKILVVFKTSLFVASVVEQHGKG